MACCLTAPSHYLNQISLKITDLKFHPNTQGTMSLWKGPLQGTYIWQITPYPYAIHAGAVQLNRCRSVLQAERPWLLSYWEAGLDIGAPVAIDFSACALRNLYHTTCTQLWQHVSCETCTIRFLHKCDSRCHLKLVPYDLYTSVTACAMRNLHYRICTQLWQNAPWETCTIRSVHNCDSMCHMKLAA